MRISHTGLMRTGGTRLRAAGVLIALFVLMALTLSPTLSAAATVPMDFSDHAPDIGSTIPYDDPSVQVSARAEAVLASATATIDGAPVTPTLIGAGTTEASASFPTFDLTSGTHSASVTFLTLGGDTATTSWSFTVPALSRHRLAYRAGSGGSIVGSATQDVRVGTSNTELEGFEVPSAWTPLLPSMQSTDTVNVLHGPTALRLSADLGADAYTVRNVNLKLSDVLPMRLYFYLPDQPSVAWPTILMTFYTSGNASRMTATIPSSRIHQGWNFVNLSAADFRSYSGATTTNTFVRMQLVLGGVAPVSVSFDSLYRDTVSDPGMVAITFDDARQSDYDQAFAYMSTLGMLGTSYIIPTVIGDGSGRLTVPELLEMDANGWEIGNHTYGHTILTSVTRDQAIAEMDDARDWIAAQGLPDAAADLAYPYGAYSASVKSAAVDAGMRYGRTTDRYDNVLPLSDPYAIGAFFPKAVSTAQSWVDTATAHQSLVVLGFHEIATSATGTDTVTQDVFRSILSYIRSKPVTIVTLGDVVGRHANDGFTVVARPGEGHHFVAWSDGVTTPVRRDLGVASDLSATAVFAPDLFTVSYSAGAGGSISGVNPQIVEWSSAGTTVTATPVEGHHFVAWSDGWPSAARRDSDVRTNRTVSASFAINEYALRYSAGANGTIEGDASQTVEWSSDGTAVTAVPSEGHHFVAWSDGVGTARRTDLDVRGDISATAIFAIDTFEIAPSAGANGSVTPSAVQVIPWRGSASFAFTPDVGHHVEEVWVDGTPIGPVKTYTFADVRVPHSITASFDINTYQLWYFADLGGSVSGKTGQSVTHGADGTPVSAVPDPGYYFVRWSDGSTANPRTDTGVTKNLAVSAIFSDITYSITPFAGANGSITPGTAAVVPQGGSQTFQIAPSSGYYVSELRIDGASIAPTSTYTFENVVANHTISAVFAWPSPTAVTLSAPSTIAFNGRAALTARVRSGSSAATGTVQFDRWNGTDWVELARAGTDPSGMAVASDGGLTTRQLYRAVFLGSDRLQPSTSGTSTVVPKASLTTPVPSVSLSRVSRTKTYAWSSTLRPAHATSSHAYFKTWRLVRKTWVPYKTFSARDSSAGDATRVRASFRLPYAGTWRVIAYAPADAGHAKSASATRTLKVR